MGAPSGCPRTDGKGDVVQLTTTGVAIHRPDGMLVFAAGDDHWALTSSGLQQWTGSWHNSLFPIATPQPDTGDSAGFIDQPAATASVQPVMLVQVLQDGSNTAVVEDRSGSMFLLEAAEGCPDMDAAVGDHVFVRSGESQTDLILMQQHETCAVAVMHTVEGE
jgi:hypothetical protein